MNRDKIDYIELTLSHTTCSARGAFIRNVLNQYMHIPLVPIIEILWDRVEASLS